MNWNVLLANALSGGFLKGKRTTVLAVVSLAGLIGQYLTGDVGAADFFSHAWPQITAIFGLITAAASGNSASNAGA